MAFDPKLAEIRFGTGLARRILGPDSVDQMLERLTGPDLIARDYPIETFPAFQKRIIEARETGKAYRQAKNAANAPELAKIHDRVKQDARRAQSYWMLQVLGRRSYTQDGFRERLIAFWTDHFTVIGKGAVMRRVAQPVAETFLRPNMTGHYADLLIAGVTNPGMVNYLDQQFSVGPNAPARAKMPPARGLNENLAREVLELHTLGVDAPYTQKDVRELAELLTGLGIDADGAQVFRENWAEPGSEMVLSQTYGGDPARMDHIRSVLTDLAVHPATARHLSRKLAVHFLGDRPDPAVVEAMERTWRDTRGHLLSVYRAMLTHPNAWTPERVNVKPPFDFISSALRVFAADPKPFKGKPNDVEQRIRKHFLNPLQRMGQPWELPIGPDGWPEQDDAWVTPQGLATRMEWALETPQVLLKGLPDPREFVEMALGPNPPESVRFAAKAAESRAEGIALVLISPAFQRR
ncbi:DUF1800 domain-containing protein [Thalassobius vesicularis]|uniref:DUF1800 domain-containing protein n=1 Tax=Thalassobius vesicularis TaxID=1294297 RepID=A0A4S3MC75_9RHOB|nr:DUF1800 domain-containing protein [Thalassobius vesicularis]THD76411.1 DUF1800 domain-containing protein [Thalassobius vesicularis]